MVLSKIAVEDSRFISLDGDLAPGGAMDVEPVTREFADHRPTPEQVLLEKEMLVQAEAAADEVVRKMWEEVRRKPRRYSKLVRVAWHCYFDESLPCQNKIARALGISDSLVSHYRKIFDNLIKGVNINNGQAYAFKAALSNRLSAVVSGLPEDAEGDYRTVFSLTRRNGHATDPAIFVDGAVRAHYSVAGA
jgi:hypothetical protein